MSPSRSTRWIDLVLAGEEVWTSIDDWVDRWHESTGPKPLHEFLGLTKREASLWAADARNLTAILYSRSRHVPLDVATERVRGISLAARRRGAFNEAEMTSFLRSEGIIPE